MPTYEGSGTEPLRSPPTTKRAAIPDSPGGGKDVGGRDNPRANPTTKGPTLPSKTVATGSDHHPEAVQPFEDDTV